MSDPSGSLERGLALHRSGDLAGAAREYEALLAREPEHADALHLLGLVVYRAGRLGDARALIGRALAHDPGNPVFHANLGNVEKDAGDGQAAAASYRRALAADPRMSAPRNNLGTLLLADGRVDEAVDCFRAVVEHEPGHARAWYNLGTALAQRGDVARAVEAHRRAVDLAPSHAPGWAELGLALLTLQRFDEAVAALERRLDLTGADAIAHADLALARHRAGDLAGAITQYEQALVLAPDDLEVRCNCVAALQKACDWERLERHWPPVAAAIHAGRAGVPAGLLTAQPGVTASMQLAAAQANARAAAQPAPLDRGAVTRRPDARVRIGYLSADFRAHATAYLTAGLFECHDRDRVEVVLLSYGPDDGSAMRRRLVAAADTFVDLAGHSDAAAAARVAQCGLDVLIDLNGNTDNGRMGIAARRPAPVQVSWLGFPGTLGVPYYDYLLADACVIPHGAERFYSEQVARLPLVYQCNDAARARPEARLTRAAAGLPPEGLVLCCFNQSFKITRDIFAVWLDVLEAVPGTVLWLLEDNDVATGEWRGGLQRRGLAAERLVVAPRRPLEEHLARYGVADLAIDTFPYGSHTTASDALWMGCPLVTLAGETFAARVAASLLGVAGLADLVTDSPAAYRALLVRLASDAVLRGDIRARAGQAHATALFDPRAFARAMEAACFHIVDRQRAGLAPQAFDLPA